MSKDRDREGEARAAVAAGPNQRIERRPRAANPPGFRVSRHAGPGAPPGDTRTGVGGLRDTLKLSADAAVNELCSAAVARITELERTLENLRPTAKVDARSRATFAG